MGQKERIEEGHPLWEGLCKQWGAERKPGHIQTKGGLMYKVLLPEGEPIFVPVGSGVDDFYGSTTTVPGTK
jgi:hypothetical protein